MLTGILVVLLCYMGIGALWLLVALVTWCVDVDGFGMPPIRTALRLAAYLVVGWPHALWVAATQLGREPEDG